MFFFANAAIAGSISEQNTALAPARAAMMLSTPVPVPLSKTTLSLQCVSMARSSGMTRFMSDSISRWYASENPPTALGSL